MAIGAARLNVLGASLTSLNTYSYVSITITTTTPFFMTKTLLT